MTYNLQIKKCENADCNVCDIIRLPQNIFNNISFLSDPVPAQCKNLFYLLRIFDIKKTQYLVDNDRYADFKSIYGTETTEQHHPTLIAAMLNSERAPSTIFANTKVRNIIQCFQCGKFRCLYSEKALTNTYLNALLMIGIIVADLLWYLKVMSFIMYVKKFHVSYQSSQLIIHHATIIHLYVIGVQGLLEFPTYMTSKYKFVFPLCNICQSEGKNFFVRIEIKTNTKGQKRKRDN